MTREQRKAELVKIQNGEPCSTGISLTYNGATRAFNVYRIPLGILTYNPYNGRIGSVVKSYERQNHQLNPDNPADVTIIEQFLWDSKKDANERTKKSLLEQGQQRYGIVTADGMIIDGNRRASLLNNIWRDASIDPSKKLHAEFFQAIILPADASKKEILRLETTYQMGEDAKVDYGPIEKYLKAKDLSDENFSEEQIASFMGVKIADVKTYLRVLALMDDYLETYGYTGIYTMLHNKDNGTSEDSFLKLEAALRQYKAGGQASLWDYDVESDVSDLKSVAFDFIRMGLDQQAFRDIIRQPSRNNRDTSFFSNKEIWEKFSKAHFDAIDAIPTEPTVEEIRSQNPTGNLDRLLRQRDTEWKRQASEKLNENFQRCKDSLNNRQQAAEPIKLLQKAMEALYAIDTEQESFLQDSGSKEYLDGIDERVKALLDLLNQ